MPELCSVRVCVSKTLINFASFLFSVRRMMIMREKCNEKKNELKWKKVFFLKKTKCEHHLQDYFNIIIIHFSEKRKKNKWIEINMEFFFC